MLVDRRTLREHLPWIIGCSIVCVAAGACYAAEVVRTGSWITGSSALGFALGALGGGIIVFEMLIWPRKKMRKWRIGRVKVWMRADVWLGLLCLPLLILHSGFYFDNPLGNVLTTLLAIVIVSGLYGLILQNVLPKQMLEDLPAETIHSQIGRVAWYSLQDAERLVSETCGPRPGETADQTQERELEETRRLRRRRRGPHRRLDPRKDGANPQDSRPDPRRGAAPRVLRRQAPSVPLRDRRTSRGRAGVGVSARVRASSIAADLRAQNKAPVIFQRPQNQAPPEAGSVVDSLERICDQRRQFDRQRVLHEMLHNWLLIHLPLSIALLVLMFVHVFQAVKFW